jgi:hypothetical protein
MPPSNGRANGDGTGELITANKGTTREDHGMVRIDHNFSSTHSLFARYTIDDSSSEGVEFRRLQENGPLDFGVNGLYEFQNLTPFGLQASINNPALEFFLQGLPLSYVGGNPSNADSDRGYRETIASGFAQDFVRVNSRLTIKVGLRYNFYSNPTEAFDRESSFPNPATDSAATVGKVFAGTPRDLLSPQAGFAWNVFGDGKTVVRHLSRPAPGGPVRSRPVSAAFLWSGGIRSPSVPEPTECSADPAA